MNKPKDDMQSMREAFEKFFVESRGLRTKFAVYDDETYVDLHTQRHWWTWQQAIKWHSKTNNS